MAQNRSGCRMDKGITAQLCLRPSPNLLPHPCSYKRGKYIQYQRVEKVFSPRCADFETFKKVSKSCLIERAVGFLPPAHTPPLLCRISLLRGFSTAWRKKGAPHIAAPPSVSKKSFRHAVRLLKRSKTFQKPVD